MKPKPASPAAPAGVLNENVPSPGPRHANFSWWRKIRLDSGATLFKFTQYDLYPGGGVSPWWAFIDEGPAGDPGLDGVLAAARRSGLPLLEYVRDAYAVMFEWNSLRNAQSGLLRAQRIRLIEPAWAFHGPVSPVTGKRPPLANPDKDEKRFPGGAFQLFIPNLTSAHIVGDGYFMIG